MGRGPALAAAARGRRARAGAAGLLSRGLRRALRRRAGPRRGRRRDERGRPASAARPCWSPRSRWRRCCCLLDAAVSIDAPVFVAVARQIVAAPADPFGFQMIWDPTSPDTAVFNRNPPLLSYWLAPWIALFGERETVMHAALLPFPVIAALAFLGCARRLAGRGRRARAAAGRDARLRRARVDADAGSAAARLLAAGRLRAACAAPRARARAGCSRRAWPPPRRGSHQVRGLRDGAAARGGGLAAATGAARAGLLCVLAPPLLAWAAWGAYTHSRYGFVHFLGSTDVIVQPQPRAPGVLEPAGVGPDLLRRRARLPGAARGRRVRAGRARRRARAARPAARHGGGRLRAAGGRAARGARRSRSTPPCSAPSPSRAASGCGRAASRPHASPPRRRIAS